MSSRPSGCGARRASSASWCARSSRASSTSRRSRPWRRRTGRGRTTRSTGRVTVESTDSVSGPRGDTVGVDAAWVECRVPDRDRCPAAVRDRPRDGWSAGRAPPTQSPSMTSLLSPARCRERPVAGKVEIGALLVVRLDDEALLDREVGDRPIRGAVGDLELPCLRAARVRRALRRRDVRRRPRRRPGRPRIALAATNRAGEPVAVRDGEAGRRRPGREVAEPVLGVDDQALVVGCEHAAALRLPACVSSLRHGREHGRNDRLARQPMTGRRSPTSASPRSSTPLPQSATSASASNRCIAAAPSAGVKSRASRVRKPLSDRKPEPADRAQQCRPAAR